MFVGATSRCCHRKIQDRHHDPAVGYMETIEQLRPKMKTNTRMAVFGKLGLDPQNIKEGNL
jgi:hypothetical protein